METAEDFYESAWYMPQLSPRMVATPLTLTGVGCVVDTVIDEQTANAI